MQIFLILTNILLLWFQALDKLELPFVVRVGIIEKISVKTPSYTSLLRMTGEPVIVSIKGVYLLVDKSVQTPEEVRLVCWVLHRGFVLFVSAPPTQVTEQMRERPHAQTVR